MSDSRLSREEYIEQEYFFRTYRERLEENVPSQEILQTIREEILATTKLPLALDFLFDEVKHRGKISDGMSRLAHYFTPFQTFVITRAEEDKARFDLKIGLRVLEHEAAYLADAPTPPGLFVYQFECISRNRLGYDRGLESLAADPFFDDQWRAWIRGVRRQLGSREFADFIFYHSQAYVDELRRQRHDADASPTQPILFGAQEGRIARANRGKDPLFMFAALQRQLNYPTVPRAKRRSEAPDISPALQSILNRLEQRLQFLEMEANQTFDISRFYERGTPPNPNDAGPLPPGIANPDP